MEIYQDHSKAKLLLCVLTSPSAAFGEILRRKLLADGLLIALAAGAVATAAMALRVYDLGTAHLFCLGKANPITWVGLLMLYGLAVHLLLKWLGTETAYHDVLTVMGWSQITLFASWLLSLIEAAFAPASSSSRVYQGIGAAGLVLQFAYLLLIGLGIRAACGATTARGTLAYILVAMATFIGFTITYGKSRLDLFAGSSQGIREAAAAVANSDSTAWLGAAAVGLAAGLLHLGKSLGWSEGARRRAAVSAGLFGLAMFGGYCYILWRTDFYGQLLSASRLYERERYAEAASRLEKLLPRMPGEAAGLSLDIADFSFVAGNDAKSLKYYHRALKGGESVPKWERQLREARIRVGIGAIHDIRGDYSKAIMEFRKAAKLWPEFREPWARLAVTYARMGNSKKAIDCGLHAVEKLKSEAAVAWLALAQAYAEAGDTKKAERAAKRLYKLNERMGKRIGKTSDEWRKAVTVLTRTDMRFPLEKQFAQEKQRRAPAKPRKR